MTKALRKQLTDLAAIEARIGAPDCDEPNIELRLAVIADRKRQLTREIDGGEQEPDHRAERKARMRHERAGLAVPESESKDVEEQVAHRLGVLSEITGNRMTGSSTLEIVAADERAALARGLAVHKRRSGK